MLLFSFNLTPSNNFEHITNNHLVSSILALVSDFPASHSRHCLYYYHCHCGSE